MIDLSLVNGVTGIKKHCKHTTIYVGTEAVVSSCMASRLLKLLAAIRVRQVAGLQLNVLCVCYLESLGPPAFAWMQ